MAKLIGFVLLAAYIGGVWKFWTGYERTNFSRSLPSRLSLAVLWPILAVASASYRQNFRKALRGR